MIDLQPAIDKAWNWADYLKHYELHRTMRDLPEEHINMIFDGCMAILEDPDIMGHTRLWVKFLAESLVEDYYSPYFEALRIMEASHD